MNGPWRQLVAEVLARYTTSTFEAAEIVRRLKAGCVYELARALAIQGDGRTAKRILAGAITEMGHEPLR